MIPDGSSNNRSWMLAHFKDYNDAKKKRFSIQDPYDPDHQIVIIMDPSVGSYWSCFSPKFPTLLYLVKF